MEYFSSNLQLQVPGGNNIYSFLKKVKRGIEQKSLGFTGVIESEKENEYCSIFTKDEEEL